MNKLILFFALLVSQNCLAQNQLKLIMDTKPVGSVLIISKYDGDMEIPLDSALYRGENTITFSLDSRYSDGVYLLEIGSLEAFQFVLINRENLNAHIYESGEGMAFKADLSKENDAFNIMLNLSDVYSQSMDSLTWALEGLSEFNPRNTAISDSLATVYRNIAEAYNNSLGLLNNLFPKSYTSEVLVHLDKIPLRSQKKDWENKFDNDAAFNHEHYFHYINFNDERILTSPFLTNKVLEYLYNYTEHSEQGIKKSVDRLLKNPELHPKVQAYLIELLIDFFTDKDAAEFVDYINRQYLGSCKLPLSEETLAKIKSSVKFNPGDQIPNVKIEGQTGVQTPLSALSSKLNVVVYWASWCPHCVRELPKLKTLYDFMKGDLGVYAVSLDTVKTEWISTINDLDLTWLNVNDLKGWDSKHVETFGITSTPSLILLDADMRWVGRASSFDGLYELVKEQLDP